MALIRDSDHRNPAPAVDAVTGLSSRVHLSPSGPLDWPIETSIDSAIVHVQYARPPYRGRLRVKDDSGQFDRMGIASLAIHYDNDDEPTAVDFRPESIAFEPGRETEISIRVQRHESLTISASGRPFDEMASQLQ